MDICTVTELQKELAASEPLILIDVRTAEELAIARIEGAHHIPLNALPMRVNELDDWRDKDIVCMCHHGMRSAQAQQILLSHGFAKVRNLTGGIHAWAMEIDPDMAKY
ncbi:MAG: hypothetical protein L3K26_17355 [Candidatus Hydrogenedentes bacterium]|nr:hypothetical protein [Candidatus Hydrogenedentota bacterium]